MAIFNSYISHYQRVINRKINTTSGILQAMCDCWSNDGEGRFRGLLLQTTSFAKEIVSMFFFVWLIAVNHH